MPRRPPPHGEGGDRTGTRGVPCSWQKKLVQVEQERERESLAFLVSLLSRSLALPLVGVEVWKFEARTYGQGAVGQNRRSDCLH